MTPARQPFMAARSTFYMGLGTLASDLMIVIIVTGLLRRRFASRRLLWRALHATAYAAWPLAILHGLLAGRSAKPYVDWSYGGCLAAVGLAVVLRYVMIRRARNAALDSPAPASSSPRPATMLGFGARLRGPAHPALREFARPVHPALPTLRGLARPALPAASVLEPLPEPWPAAGVFPPAWRPPGDYGDCGDYQDQ